MFLLCVKDLKQNACCRLSVLFVPLFPNPRREFLALLASIGDGNDRHGCSCCVYYYCSCSVDFPLLLQDGSSTGKGSETTNMLRRNGTKTGSRNLDELLFSPAEEQVKVNELRAAIGPLTGHANTYATDACLKRYLRARNWNIKKAEKMLRDSLHWRSVFKPEEIQWADISGESETGKVYRATFRDKHDHTVIVMHPTRQNTSNMDGQIKQLVYTLENTILNLPPGQEQMVWLIDFHGWGVKHSTPIKTAREIANILQNHYPERLHVGILFNPPRVFQAFMTIVKPFLDPKTFQKVKFVYTRNPESCKLLDDYFANDILKEVLENPADYNHEEYAKLMEQDDLKSATYWKLGEED